MHEISCPTNKRNNFRKSRTPNRPVQKSSKVTGC
jgi:hypothetical protein